MSILPTFLAAEIEEQIQETPKLTIPKEYGIDFSTGQLTGKIVEGKEAIKVWIWNCLHTSRFRYGIHTWEFGWNPDEYVGMAVTAEYIQADAETEIEEALMKNPYITGIDDFSAVKVDERLTITFTALTQFGDVKMEVSEDV